MAAGCDVQAPTPERERDARVAPKRTGANVANDTPLPANGTIKVAFDRLLHPLYVTRQSFQLREASGALVQPLPAVIYDPVSRVVTIAGATSGNWLTPGLFYKLVMPAAADASDVFGLRSFNGVPLEAEDSISFAVVAPTSPAPPTDPQIDFCSDILGSIFRAKQPTGFRCTDAGCHGAYRDGIAPSMNLILETESGIVNTAIGRAARTVNQGAIAGPGSPSKRAFPSDMPLIDPYNPGNSYIIYKVLLSPLPTPNPEGGLNTETSCNGLAALQNLSLAPGSPLGDDERARLSDWMVGRQMPYFDPTFGLTTDELERLSLWIAQGAPVVDCTSRCKY